MLQKAQVKISFKMSRNLSICPRNTTRHPLTMKNHNRNQHIVLYVMIQKRLIQKRLKIQTAPHATKSLSFPPASFNCDSIRRSPHNQHRALAHCTTAPLPLGASGQVHRRHRLVVGALEQVLQHVEEQHAPHAAIERERHGRRTRNHRLHNADGDKTLRCRRRHERALRTPGESGQQCPKMIGIQREHASLEDDRLAGLPATGVSHAKNGAAAKQAAARGQHAREDGPP